MYGTLSESLYLWNIASRSKVKRRGKKRKGWEGGAIIKRAGDLPSRHQGLASLPTFSVISASLLSIPS